MIDINLIVSAVLSALNPWLPFIAASVKSASGKAKLRARSAEIRIAGNALIAIADEIDSVFPKLRRRK